MRNDYLFVVKYSKFEQYGLKFVKISNSFQNLFVTLLSKRVKLFRNNIND